MSSNLKRKSIEVASSASFRKKTKTYASGPHKWHSRASEAILAGDAGIWISCDKGREARCVAECRLLFEEFAVHHLSDDVDDSSSNRPLKPEADSGHKDDIEGQILQEIDQAHCKETSTNLFENVKIQSPCLVFFKTRPPIDPSAFVKDLCLRMSDLKQFGVRYTRRLTPVCLFARATLEDLGAITAQTLPRYFSTSKRQKFAIRVTVRNNNVLKREEIIKAVASIVGAPHTVDLKCYDLLILVDVYKHLCGIAVVDSEYERLRKFNLAELSQESSTSRITSDGTRKPSEDLLTYKGNDQIRV